MSALPSLPVGFPVRPREAPKHHVIPSGTTLEPSEVRLGELACFIKHSAHEQRFGMKLTFKERCTFRGRRARFSPLR